MGSNLLPLLFLIHGYHPLQVGVIYPSSASKERGGRQIKIRRMFPALEMQR